MSLRRSVTASAFLALSVVASGCTTGGAAPLDEDFYGDAPGEVGCVRSVDDFDNVDTSVDSPTDLACHEDCIRPCGFNGSPHYPRGIKYCECQSGVYIECRCPRADWYIAAPDAPYCDDWTIDGSGRTMSINPRECTKEFKQCIARDPVDGYTPRGCVCLDRESRPGMPSDPTRLEWVCASTEKWFYPEQSVIP